MLAYVTYTVMTSFKPDHYYLYTELTELLQNFAAKYPELAALESLGKTSEQRDIWILTITAAKTADKDQLHFVRLLV